MPQIEVETHKVAAPDVVIPTIDTVRHESLLYTWLAEHKPMVLCGPPGSGKTMTLFSALRALPDLEVIHIHVLQYHGEQLFIVFNCSTHLCINFVFREFVTCYFAYQMYCYVYWI